MLTVKDINLVTSDYKYDFLNTLTNIELVLNNLDELQLMFKDYLLDTIYETDNSYLD